MAAPMPYSQTSAHERVSENLAIIPQKGALSHHRVLGARGKAFPDVRLKLWRGAHSMLPSYHLKRIRSSWWSPGGLLVVLASPGTLVSWWSVACRPGRSDRRGDPGRWSSASPVVVGVVVVLVVVVIVVMVVWVVLVL